MTPGQEADRPPANCYILPMATRLVISLVVLAMALLTYAPADAPFMAMAADGNAAMGECAMPEGNCCDDGKNGAGRTCAIDDRCLASCAFSAGLPSFHVAAPSFPFGLPSKSSAADPDQARPASASGLPLFRPPRSLTPA